MRAGPNNVDSTRLASAWLPADNISTEKEGFGHSTWPWPLIVLICELHRLVSFASPSRHIAVMGI
jgi:hypothetical protein